MAAGALDSGDLTPVAADATNDMSFDNDGGMVLRVINGATGAVQVTVKRPVTGDTYGDAFDQAARTVAINKQRDFGPFKPRLFSQSDGKVYVDFDVDAAVTVVVLRNGNFAPVQ
jgi:hypothetical protein